MHMILKAGGRAYHLSLSLSLCQTHPLQLMLQGQARRSDIGIIVITAIYALGNNKLNQIENLLLALYVRTVRTYVRTTKLGTTNELILEKKNINFLTPFIDSIPPVC